LQKEYEQETSKSSQFQNEKKNLETEIITLKQQMNDQKNETEKLRVILIFAHFFSNNLFHSLILRTLQ
jgi:hypothetical protein